MKRRINYESKTVLPDEVLQMFRKTENLIWETREEADKSILYLQKLKFDLTSWFSEHETILEETP
jgi:hypothetical protein